MLHTTLKGFCSVHKPQTCAPACSIPTERLIRLQAVRLPFVSALGPSALCICLQGFRSVYKPQRSGSVQFAELLDAVAQVDPEMRIRFTSPHPKDFSDDVLQVSPAEPCSEWFSKELAACEGWKLYWQGISRSTCCAQVRHVQIMLYRPSAACTGLP